MSRLVSVLLFACMPLLAGITIVEQSPGMIRLKITADTIKTEAVGNFVKLRTDGDLIISDRNGNEIPAFKLSIFTNNPERATLSLSIQKKAIVNTARPIRKAADDSEKLIGSQSAIKGETYRFTPIHHWVLTPILSIQNGVIEQFVEAEAIIRYIPPTRTDNPNGDYEKIIASSTLNPSEFYRTMPARSRKASSELWLSPTEQALTFTIGGTAGKQNEADGSADRMVRLTPAMLSQLGSSIPLNQICVYGSNLHSFSEQTPAVDSLPSALIKIPLILRDHNKNGIFDSSDEILFFAMGANYWYSTGSKWQHFYNDYSENRHFYITKSPGLVAAKGTFPTTGGTTTTAGLQLIRVRQSSTITSPHPRKYPGNSSRSWIWTALTSDNSSFTSDVFPVFNQATSTPATMILHYYSDRNTATSKTANIAFLPVGQSQKFKISSSFDTIEIPAGSEKCTFSISGLVKDTSALDFQGYSIRYYQNLIKNRAQQLRFYSDEGSSFQNIASYRVSNIEPEFNALFRINPTLQTIDLIDTVSVGGTVSWNDYTGQGFQYIIASLSDVISPKLELVTARTTVQNSTYQIRDLHNKLNKSDYMIVCPPEFVPEAIELAQHKVSTGRFSSPTVVTTEDIYREFSGGVAHPAAIRNFMVYVQNNWKDGPALDYLILLGNGHYDYKGIQFPNIPNYIPPYIDSDGENVAIEDFYAYTRTNKIPTIAIGRVPARTRVEVRNFIEKLVTMESDGADNGEWRNQQVLLSDDDLMGDDTPEGLDHVISSDKVGKTILEKAPAVNIKKVTLFEYPLSGSEKPAAKDALLNLLNKGVGAFNYFGHGAPDQVAHEKTMTLSDIASLTNYRRYLIFSAFSCSVGFFDIPGTPCFASKMVTDPKRGAIGAIASVRTSTSGPNENMAKTFFSSFYSDSNFTLGTAYLKAKTIQNLDYYALFGDPSYKPLAQNRRFTTTVLTADGTPTDSIQGAQTILVKAKLPAGSNIDSVRVHIQNPSRENLSRKDGAIGKIDWKYSLPGSFVISRSVAVVGDSISMKIKIPPFSTIPIKGMILRLYGWNNSKPQTVTSYRELSYSGIDPTGLDQNDKFGPGIAARIFQDTTESEGDLPGAAGNRIVIDGFPKSATDLVSKPVAVELFLSDSSSIDVSSDNPGDGITMGVQGIRNSRSYNDEFQPIQDDPNKGRVLLYFSEDEFPQPGEYTMTVTAGDYLKNRTKTEFVLDVKSKRNGVYDIGDFYAYPSPVHLGETTRFMFNTPTASTKVHRITLKIFTLSGQLVRQFNDVKPGVSWDLTDQKGNRLSPNVYLYRLYVERDARLENTIMMSTPEKEQIRSEIRKMIIYPPRYY